MRYMIKQKMLTLSDSFDITDEHDQTAFTVKGKLISLSDKLIFSDPEGKELARITRKLISLRPTFTIHRHGKVAAKVKKKMSIIRENFSLDGPGMKGVSIKGNIWDSEYTFRRKSTVLATVSKHFWTLSDTYGVEIPDEDTDAVLILAAAIAIDMIRDGEKDD